MANKTIVFNINEDLKKQAMLRAFEQNMNFKDYIVSLITNDLKDNSTNEN